METKSGYLEINGAHVYYEETGQGTAFIMVHAGVADRRQWDDQFRYFAGQYRVIRFDMRGYGNTPLIAGSYSDRDDLLALMDTLGVDRAILMGCSKGGMTIIDFATEHPQRVIALIPVGSGLSGFAFEGDPPPYWEDLQSAYKEGNMDMAAEYATRIWFDSQCRTPEQMNPIVRAKALDMARSGLRPEPEGVQVLHLTPPSTERFGEISDIPMLAIVGDLDNVNILRIADTLTASLPHAQKAVMTGTAHLPNVEQPEEFNRLLDNFLMNLKV